MSWGSRWITISLCLIGLAAAIIVVRMQQPLPRLAPLVAEANVVAAVPVLSGVAQPQNTELLRITVAPQALPASVSIETITADLYAALAYVSERTAINLTAPIAVRINASPDCALHGVAYTDIREVQVFTCSALPPSRAVNILAHEFVHQLAHDYYGAAHLRSDPILLEGWATWGAGRYWLGQMPDFRTFVGTRPSLPLVASHLGRPAAEMNTLYYQWASFVEYLIITYGRTAFDDLYRSGAGTPGSADYQGVYGIDLPTLEAQWRTWLNNGGS